MSNEILELDVTAVNQAIGRSGRVKDWRWTAGFIAFLLLIVLTATGCGGGGAQGKINPDLPVVSVKIEGMT